MVDAASWMPGWGRVEAMRLAVLTVSPKTEYFGAPSPITPAVQRS